MDDVEKKMREAGKIMSDPALTAIQELNDDVATSFKLLEEEDKRTGEKVEKLYADLKGELALTRTEMQVGIKANSDKLNTLDRRSIALGYGRDIEGCCLAALGEEERRDIAVLDWMMPRSKRNDPTSPMLSSPVGAALVANWLLVSFKLQKRRFASQAQEAELYRRMERYEKAICEAFGLERAAAFNTSPDAMGGHWLPDPVAAELYRQILDNSVIGGLASHVPMTTKTLDLPTEGSSGLTVSWGSESTTITDSVPASNAIAKVTLTANRLNGRGVSSIEELQDSAISILSWVQTKLTEMAGREIDKQALEGTGSPFTGLAANASVNEIAAATNGDLLTYQTLVDTVYKARERASREGARWFVAPEIMGKIVGLTDTQNMPVVQFGNVPNAVQPSILGYPVEVHSVISAARTWGTGTGLSNIYFGPPPQIVIGDRMGMAWDVSDIPGFTTAEVHMRLMARLAVAVAVPAAFTRRVNLKAV